MGLEDPATLIFAGTAIFAAVMSILNFYHNRARDKQAEERSKKEAAAAATRAEEEAAASRLSAEADKERNELLQKVADALSNVNKGEAGAAEALGRRLDAMEKALVDLEQAHMNQAASTQQAIETVDKRIAGITKELPPGKTMTIPTMTTQLAQRRVELEEQRLAFEKAQAEREQNWRVFEKVAELLFPPKKKKPTGKR